MPGDIVKSFFFRVILILSIPGFVCNFFYNSIQFEAKLEEKKRFKESYYIIQANLIDIENEEVPGKDDKDDCNEPSDDIQHLKPKKILLLPQFLYFTSYRDYLIKKLKLFSFESTIPPERTHQFLLNLLQF